ncbi:MAG: insulinase family protein [Clostridia bacterium]|nr:insulinase family protein [Clostridia bacterium]
MENKISNEYLSQIPKEYKIEKKEYIKCIDSMVFILRHIKSGAKVAVFFNDDENKLFSAAFKTPPIDDCGTPHIIEHSVLCGSERYPVKDPFMELVKSSMQTFLNAMTYADKTVYPVASCNDADFINLSNIYLDAVFAPNIAKNKEIFMQEGWHYEPDGNGGLDIGGVVYSEMLGAMSSPDSSVYDGLISALFPGNAYGKNSGGDPEHIPSLSYEAFLQYYKSHYHPSNCYITLYGNMDHRERLEYIDREYLSKYELLDINFDIPESPLNRSDIVRVEKKYAVLPDAVTEGKNYFAFGSVCADALDAVECMAYDFLSDILVESPGAPVKNALISAGIGEEIFGGFLNHIKKPAFSVIAKNTNANDEERFIKTVKDTLLSISENGINKKSLLAVIERSEFRFREGEQGSTPRGLHVNLSMLQNWMYSDDDPFAYIKADELLSELRRLVDSGYYETLVKKILDSDSKVLFVMSPEAGLNEKNSELLREKLRAYRETLSEEEYKYLCDEFDSFSEYQNREETEEELSCIPMLSLDDISKTPPPVSYRLNEICGIPSIIHDVKTNGIVYARLMFDISHITNDRLPYLDILSSVLGKVDTSSHSYEDILDEVRLNTGGFGFSCEVYRKKDPSGAFRPVYEINLRVLNNKLEKALELVKEIIFETRFDDMQRIREIITEMLSEKQRDIVSSGSEYASARALAYFSAADAFEDYLDGIASYLIQKDLMNDYKKNYNLILKELQKLTDEIFLKNICTISIAADSDIFDFAAEQIGKFVNVLPRRDIPREAERLPLGVLNEAFLTTSKVQYVATAGNLSLKGYNCDGRYQILSSVLKNDYLYPEIRMKGGAYGYSCSFSVNSGNVAMVTYRDPCLVESLNVFKNSAEYIKNLSLTEDELKRHIIGTFGRLDRPMSAYIKVSRALALWMSGRTYDDILRDRTAMMNVTESELRTLSPSLRDTINLSHVCVIGNEEKLRENSSQFKNLIKLA